MRLVIIVLLFVFTCPWWGWAQTLRLNAHPPDYDAVFTFKDDSEIKIKMNLSGGYIEIVTKKATFKFYPCGKIEKLTWKEINPNEEQGDIVVNPGSIFPLYRGTNTLELNRW